MNLHLKNTLSALFISTAIVACGGGSFTTTVRYGGSVLDNPISQEAKQAVIDTHDYISPPKGLSQEEGIKFLKEEFTKKLSKLEDIFHKSNNESEKKYLSIFIKSLKGQLLSLELTSEKSREDNDLQIFSETSISFNHFYHSYLQNRELESYLETYNRIKSNLYYASKNLKNSITVESKEKYIAEINALKGDLERIESKILDMYNNPQLSDYFKREMEELASLSLLPVDISKPLSANTPNPTEDVSLRRARNQEPHADFSQLMVNGVSGGYATLSMPVYLQLKGTIEGSKETTGLTGLVVYKLNNTLVGIIHGYANASINRLTPLNHNESSVVVSHSFGMAYLEGQAGFVRSSINQQDVSGDRYQLAAGYDFEYVTPFVQASVRNLNGLNEHSVQAGCEVDIVNLVTDQYTLSTRMTLKGGYHSFKGTVGSIEGSFELGFNNGVHIQTGFKASSKDASTAQISLSFDQ